MHNGPNLTGLRRSRASARGNWAHSCTIPPTRPRKSDNWAQIGTIRLTVPHVPTHKSHARRWCAKWHYSIDPAASIAHASSASQNHLLFTRHASPKPAVHPCQHHSCLAASRRLHTPPSRLRGADLQPAGLLRPASNQSMSNHSVIWGWNHGEMAELSE